MGLSLFILACIAAPLLLSAAIRFIYLPYRIWRSPGLKDRLEARETHVEQLSPELREFIDQTVQRFGERGFALVQNTSEPQLMSNFHATTLFLLHATTGDRAVAVYVWSDSSRLTSIAIVSEFEDGRRVSTLSAENTGAHPRNPSIDAANFSWVRDPALLVAAHHRRLAKRGLADARRILLSEAEAREYKAREHDREMQRLVQAGRMWHDARTGRYRYTLRGACAAAWKSVEPVKSILRRLRDRAARREWRELGLDDQSLGGPPANAPEQSADNDDARTDRLEYEPALRSGELHVERLNGSTIIRAGAQTPGDYLLEHWPDFIFISLFFGIVGLTLLLGYTMSSKFGVTTMRQFATDRWWMLLLVGWAVFDIVKLTRGVRTRRRVRTTNLTVSTAGIRFQNAMDGTRDGFIERHAVSSLLVLRRGSSTFRRSFMLRVMHSTGSHDLFAGKQEVLEGAREVIMTAMGVQTTELH